MVDAAGTTRDGLALAQLEKSGSDLSKTSRVRFSAALSHAESRREIDVDAGRPGVRRAGGARQERSRMDGSRHQAAVSGGVRSHWPARQARGYRAPAQRHLRGLDGQGSRNARRAELPRYRTATESGIPPPAGPARPAPLHASSCRRTPPGRQASARGGMSRRLQARWSLGHFAFLPRTQTSPELEQSNSVWLAGARPQLPGLSAIRSQRPRERA